MIAVLIIQVKEEMLKRVTHPCRALCGRVGILTFNPDTHHPTPSDVIPTRERSETGGTCFCRKPPPRRGPQFSRPSREVGALTLLLHQGQNCGMIYSPVSHARTVQRSRGYP